MLKRRVFPLVVFFILVLASTSLAGFGVGGNLLISLPQEDFANVSETGGGLGLKFPFSPPLMPGIAVRADFAFVVYGTETYEDQVAGITVDIETRHQSVQFTIGPHVYNYSTEVSIEGTDISETKSSTTKFGWNFCGGMLIRVYQNPIKKFKLDIDLGTKYHTIKEAIETEIDGVVITSDANDISIHAGVLFHF
jgi:hypothetical protein